MKNREIAEIFYEIADILEMQGVEFKPRAYRRAAKNIESLSEDIEEVAKKGKLREIPGVGENISKKIEEIVKTGKLKYFEELKKQVPGHIDELMQIPGMGPKKANLLYKKLKINTIAQLEKAAKQNKLAKLEGLGEKSQQDILRGIEFLKKHKGRILLGFAYPVAEEIVDELKKLKECKKVIAAGSLRRMKETIGDIDILVTSSKPKKVMEHFTKLKQVKDVVAKGPTKSSIITEDNIQVDVRVIDDKLYGSALQYFTGSKEHSIKLREIAIKKGLKLSEYGVFKKKGNRLIASKTEQDVYKALGMEYIEPELRENNGEMQAAIEKKLPKLICYGDVRGDLHVHSNYSDGSEKIEVIVKEAKKLGYEYIAIADHSQSQKIAHGLEERRLLKQIKEIDKLNKRLNKFTVLKGTEVDIKADGSLDYPDSVLKKLDIVTAAVHSGFKFPKEKMTARLLKAMDNKYVNIIAHPTGRLINKREAYEVDLTKIYEKAVERNIFLEINAFPDRLDLNDVNIRAAKEYSVKFAINTDAHNSSHLPFMKLGIATARRGWAEKKDIINTLPLNKLLRILKN